MTSPAPPPMKLCPNCRSGAALQSPSCPRCGHLFRTRFPSGSLDPTQVVSAPGTAVIACPVCGNADVQKVSAVFGGGSWSGSSVGTSVGVGHVMGGPDFVTASSTVTSIGGATTLAQRLAPPSQPQMPRDLSGCLVWVLGSFAIIFALTALGSGSPPDGETPPSPAGAIFATAVLGCGAVAAWRWARAERRARERQFELAMQAWRVHTSRWEQMFYCRRCDFVHNHWSKQYALVANAGSLIYF